MSDKVIAKVGVVTVSDRAFAGVYEDLGGPAIISFLTQHLTSEWVAVSRVVPDETDVVAATLIELADTEHCSLIFTIASSYSFVHLNPSELSPFESEDVTV